MIATTLNNYILFKEKESKGLKEVDKNKTSQWVVIWDQNDIPDWATIYFVPFTAVETKMEASDYKTVYAVKFEDIIAFIPREELTWE